MTPSIVDRGDGSPAGADPDAAVARPPLVGAGARPATSPHPLAGRALGDFVVRGKLGEGGSGEVLLAEQPALGREAVIKVLRGGSGAGADRAQRFLREARLASRLDHPYAAHVYAFGAEPDGLLWIAMEHVRGTTLAELLARQGPLPLERLVPILERLCEVVHSAHQQGIVHRDLKPANVMIVARAGRLLPKLLDLGIARMIGVRIPDEETEPERDRDGGAATGATGRDPTATLTTIDVDASLTRVGDVVGSPAFMAPEQWFSPATVDGRADIYALGALIYTALTGRLAFDGATARDVARAHARQPPPALGPGFAAGLDAVLARALAKRPEDRFATPLELAAALRDAAGAAAPPELPALDATVRDAFLGGAPPPLADALAAYDAARDVTAGRDALATVVGAAVRWLAVVALAARTQRGGWRADDADTLGPHLAALRRGALDDHAWLALARAAAAPAAAAPELFAVPELAALLAAPAPIADAIAAVAAVADDDLAGLTTAIAAVERALRALGFVLDYPLVVRRGGRVERWMGTRRRRRPAAWVRDADRLDDDAPTLIDGDGAVVTTLAPYAQVASPAAGVDAELFVLDRGVAEGAVLIAIPDGYERRDDPWPALGVALPADDPAAIADDEPAPYRGLEPFGPGDAAWFFGRDDEAEATANRLRQRRLVAIVGPSGAGKSSFVLAGVLPRLGDVTAIVVRPGAQPLAALAARLAAVERVPGRPLVVVVDQLEELITQCADPELRVRFADRLVELASTDADGPDGGVRVVVTVRDDFLVRIAQLGALRPWLEAGLHLLATPPPAELRRIVALPARRAGYAFDDATVVDDMVAAVAGQAGALPLLSFTASRLWRARDRRLRQLTRAAHDALGGVGGALAGHAEATLAALGDAGAPRVREAFRNLATAEGTRTALSRGELRELLGGDAGADEVVSRLVDARLLTSTEDPGGGDRIEIVHEALLDAWPRLRGWRRDDAERARLRDALRDAARQWHDRGRPRGLLWRGDALDEYRLWRARYPGSVTAREDAFARASLADAARGRRLRRAAVVIALAGLAATAIVLSLANREARRQERAAVSARAAAAASADDARGHMVELLVEQGRAAALDDRPAEAMAWLAEALDRGADPTWVRELAMVPMTALRRLEHIYDGGSTRLLRGVATPAGDRVVTTESGFRGRALLWDGADGHQVATLGASPSTYFDVAFVDGLIALTSTYGDITLWSARDGAAAGQLAHAGAIDLDVSADGRLLAVGRDGAITVWPPGRATQATIAAGTAATAAHWRDGDVVAAERSGNLAVWSADGQLRHRWPGAIALRGLAVRGSTAVGQPVRAGRAPIWDVVTGRHREVGGDGAPILAVAVSPDGDRVVTASADGTTTVWAAATAAPLVTLVGHRGPVVAIAISPSGRSIVTGSEDQSARLWDLATGLPLAVLSGHGSAVVDVGFAGEDHVVTTSVDGTARRWSAARGELRIVPAPVGGGSFVELAGDHLLVAGTRRAVALVDRDGVAAVEPANPDAAAERFGTPLTIGSRRLAAWSPAARRLAAPTGDGVTAWDHRGQVVGGCRGDGNTAITAALAPAGDIAVAGDLEGGLVWCDLATGIRRPLAPLRGTVYDLAFSADGSQLAVAGRSPEIVLLDGHTGAPGLVLHGHSSAVSAIRFGADGRLTSASLDGTVRTWDVASGRQLTELRASTRCNGVAVTATGRVFGAGEDGALWVWNAAHGQLVARIAVGRAPLTWVDAAADGSTIAVASVTDQIGLLTLREVSIDEIRRVARCALPYRIEGNHIEQQRPTCAPE